MNKLFFEKDKLYSREEILRKIEMVFEFNVMPQAILNGDEDGETVYNAKELLIYVLKDLYDEDYLGFVLEKIEDEKNEMRLYNERKSLESQMKKKQSCRSLSMGMWTYWFQLQL